MKTLKYCMFNTFLIFGCFCSTMVSAEGTAADKTESSNTSESKSQDVTNDSFEQMLDQFSFSELMDVNVALNPDWEANSPTKFAQKSSLSPAYVTVISKEDILQFGYQSVAEILSYIEGFVFTTDLTLANFGSRGMHPGARAGNRIIKVMIDGQPISFQTTSHNWIERNLIPLQLIERVEVIKGPVSALYGADAFMGVVNVVTKRGDEFMRKGNLAHFEWASITEAGNGFGVSVVGGYQNEKWDNNWGIEYHQLDRAGLSLPITAPDYQRHQDGEQGRMLVSTNDDSNPLTMYTNSQYTIDAKQHIRLAAHYQEMNEDQVYSDLTGVRSTGASHIALYNGFLRFDYTRKISKQWSWSSHVSYASGGSKNDDKIELGTDQFYLKRNMGYQSWQLNTEGSWQPDDTNFWLFGFDYHTANHEIADFTQVNADGERSIYSEVSDEPIDNWAVYAQWFKQWSKSLSSLVGYRVDQHDVYNRQQSERLGFVYQLNAQQQLKLLYGSSFQAPSPELLYRNAISQGDISGNETLRPQEADTLELIFSGSYHEKTRYSATLFINSIDDLVRYENEINNQVAQNSAKSDSYGVEGSISYRQDNFRYFANVSWQETEVESNQVFVLENRKQGELYPSWEFNAGISYLFTSWNGQVYLNSQYQSERPASTTNVIRAETEYDYADSWEFDFGIYKKLNGIFDGAQVRLHIDNLFNERHAHPGFNGIDAPDLGRVITLSYSQRF